MMEPYSLCIGKAGSETEIALGSECSSVLENQVIGLLPISSYIYDSLDATCKAPAHGTCQNYNYLEADFNWWSLSTDVDNTYRVYSIMSGSSASVVRASALAVPREVLRLTENSVYVSGDGSAANPFVLK